MPHGRPPYLNQALWRIEHVIPMFNALPMYRATSDPWEWPAHPHVAPVEVIGAVSGVIRVGVLELAPTLTGIGRSFGEVIKELEQPVHHRIGLVHADVA